MGRGSRRGEFLNKTRLLSPALSSIRWKRGRKLRGPVVLRRSHPGPLPQEKENLSLRLGDANPPGCHVGFFRESPEGGTLRATSGIHKAGNRCSLSSGERVRVRASVQLTFPVQILRRHWPCAVRQRMGRAGLQFAKNGVANRLLVPTQARVPKAEFLDAHRGEKLGSLRVVRLLAGMPMLSAIEFKREIRLPAVEIQEVSSDWMTTPKFVSAETSIAKPTSDEFFDPGGLLSQGAGTFDVGHDANINLCGSEEKNSVNNRPHPGLLPQEKENCAQVFGGADAPDCRAFSSANDQNAGTMRATFEIYEAGNSCSLSPGRGRAIFQLNNYGLTFLRKKPDCPYPKLIPPFPQNL